MAIIDFVKGKNSTFAAMRKVINYIKNPEKAEPHLISALNCDPNNTYEAFSVTKSIFKKEKGRQYIHFVQSFHPNDDVSPEKVHTMGNELLKHKVFDNFQILMATHTDTKHLHNHFIINSVNAENGKKWKFSKRDLVSLKEYNDQLCQKYGVRVYESEKGYVRSGEYRAIGQMNSWKHELHLAIKECRKTSINKNDFINKMNRLGYEVDWNYKGESYDSKYTSAVINVCKNHSTSKDDFIKNMKHYNCDIVWEYKLKTIPINDVEELGEEITFNDFLEMQKYIDTINSKEFQVEWTDKLIFKSPEGKIYSPESFESLNSEGQSLRKAFETNHILGVKELPGTITIPEKNDDYKKMLLAIKACKRNSLSKEMFVKNMESLGYKVHWNIEPSEKKIFEASLEEAKKSSTLEEYEKQLKQYGYVVKREGEFFTVSNGEKDDFEFKKYDASYIMGEFKKEKLDLNVLKLKFEKRYNDQNQAQKQFEIFQKRLDLLVDHGYVDRSHEQYTITQKGIQAKEHLSGFSFTTYDANVVFSYIEKSDGTMTEKQLEELLNEEYDDPEYASKQFEYLKRRLENNVKEGTLVNVNGAYRITEIGFLSKEAVTKDYHEEKNTKENVQRIRLNINAVKKAIESNGEVSPKSHDEIIQSLIKERKHVSIELPSGKRVRSRTNLFEKDKLHETFLFNSTMKQIIDKSLSKSDHEICKIAHNMGYYLKVNEKNNFEFQFNEDLKCFFTRENIDSMKLGNFSLPDESEIFKVLSEETIMFTNPEGKQCSNKSLFPFENYRKDSLNDSFEKNRLFKNEQQMNEQFELLLGVISMFSSQQQQNAKYPLSKLEGDAYKEKLIELSKGESYDWEKER